KDLRREPFSRRIIRAARSSDPLSSFYARLRAVVVRAVWVVAIMSATSRLATKRTYRDHLRFVRFSNRPSGSSALRLSTTPVSMLLTGSRFSSDSAPRPFHHGDSKTRRNNLLGVLRWRRSPG